MSRATVTFSECVLGEFHRPAICAGSTSATTLNIIVQPVNTANEKRIVSVDPVRN